MPYAPVPPELAPAFASTLSIFDQMNRIREGVAAMASAEATKDREAETDAFTDHVLSHVAPTLAAWNRAFPRPRYA